MKRAWHRTNPGLFATVRRDLEREYSDLRVVIERGTVFSRGSFPVTDGAEILDRFLIEIQFPDDYPDSVPILREIGGRIPWHEERHTNRTGEACPIVPEEWLIRPDHNSILQFLNGPNPELLYRSAFGRARETMAFWRTTSRRPWTHRILRRINRHDRCAHFASLS
jgi:hypothetical protein